MLQDKKIKNCDCERVSQMLGKLFEVDSDITEQISRCIQYYGVTEFFRSIETFDFSVDVFEKLYAVRLVLFGMGEVSIIPEELLAQMYDSDIEAIKGGEEM